MDWVAIINSVISALLAANWVAIISIVSSAIVAITSAWAPVRLEKQKAIREEAIQKEELRRKALAEIDATTTELLRLLSLFRGQGLSDVNSNLEGSGLGTHARRAASLLLGQFYVWESKVWDKLTPADHELIKGMRAKIASKQIEYSVGPHVPNPFAEDLPEIVEQVLLLTRHATGRE